MKTPRIWCCRRLGMARAVVPALMLVVSMFLAPRGVQGAPLDLNNDSIPDIWALVYDAGGVDPEGDADGDGLKNAAEAVAGTNPFSPGSTVKIIDTRLDTGGLHVTFPTLLGKGYQVQSSQGLSPAAWTAVGPVHEGVGADYTAVIDGEGAGAQFYRVVVQELDSDGDGVTDWEEIQAGLNPHSTHSNGPGGPDDLTALTQALQSPNAVSISAGTMTVREPPSSGVSTNVATIVITRTGGLGNVTVNYSVSGTALQGVDFAALSGTVTLPMGVNSATIAIVPLADDKMESPETVVLSLNASPNYAITGPPSAAVLITDHAQPNGDGLLARFYNEANTLNTSGTIPPGVEPTWSTLVVTRVDPVINYTWTSGSTQGVASPAPGVKTDYFASRWTGEVLPEFSQVYTFEVEYNRCARLWVNGQLLVNRWPGNGATNDNPSGTASATIELEAGVRYPIVLEHFETTGDAKMHLRWQSANQPKEIIPMVRMFSAVPPQILSGTELLLLKGGNAVSYQIVASANPTSYSAANLPPGWSVNTLTGVISGSPTQVGTWQVPITATNSVGSGSAILTIRVLETGGGITRDVWNGTFNSVAALPLDTEPASTAVVNALESPQNAGNNFGARLRGYITAPTTGAYKFWITGDDNAELWISDDDEPVNLFKRAATSGATGYRQWTHAAAGVSPLLWLEAGQRYYVEVRHVDVAGNDHVSVGWLKPGQSGTSPSEVVPGYALSPWEPPTGGGPEGTLYLAVLTPQGGIQTTAYGTCTLRLSADRKRAYVTPNYSNLSSPYFGMHVHDDRLPPAANIVFDLDEPGLERLIDGTYVWEIQGTGTLSAEQIADGLATNAYFNVHSNNYTGGEIKGYFRRLDGSTTFTSPAPQTWTDPNSAGNPESHRNRDGAARFLIQATYGPSANDIAAVQNHPQGFAGWIDDQIALPPTHLYPYVYAHALGDGGFTASQVFNAWWRASVTAPDQLRQRMAFALSEILVVSEEGPLDGRSHALSDYYDTLLDYSFGNSAVVPGPNVPPADGNFRNLLKAVTLHPAMGRYLDMLRNDKPDLATGRIPNENYAREILQLFAIGLNRMHPDGSLVLNSKGQPIPTYDQNAIIGFAHAFTGWDYHYTGAYRTSFGASSNWVEPMREVPRRHFIGPKRLLNNVVLPGLPELNGQPLDPYENHSSAIYSDPLYQSLPARELDATHDAIFHHPNVGPFISRQLIQRFVTSTPSPAYIYRVASKFNDNGAGVRGDLKAVIKAILLDPEARSLSNLNAQGYGKQREPVMRVTAVARAFPPPPPVSGTYTQTGSTITVNTTAPHLFSTGNSIYLEFGNATSGTPGAPLDATYSVTVTSPTQFTLTARSLASATYVQGGSVIKFTIADDDEFDFDEGDLLHAEFLTGTPIKPANRTGTVEYMPNNDQDVYFAAPNARRFSYSQAASSTTVTLTLNGHGLTAGSSVRIDFVSGTNPPASGIYTINSATANDFTITVASAAARSGVAFAVPSANMLPAASGTAKLTAAAEYAANRTGPIMVTYSDWNIRSTDDDLNQTPLKSPTVFNFFQPDYRFPGILANAGLITPEFEITSETSVIRQSNFMWNGIMATALGENGLSAFRSGSGRDIILDLRPWMAAGPGGLPWVHNNNLNALIAELNTRLMAGQLPPEAATIIRNYVATLPYSNTPSATQLRNRIRAVVHLIVTSPDFAIQK